MHSRVACMKDIYIKKMAHTWRRKKILFGRASIPFSSVPPGQAVINTEFYKIDTGRGGREKNPFRPAFSKN